MHQTHLQLLTPLEYYYYCTYSFSRSLSRRRHSTKAFSHFFVKRCPCQSLTHWSLVPVHVAAVVVAVAGPKFWSSSA